MKRQDAEKRAAASRMPITSMTPEGGTSVRSGTTAVSLDRSFILERFNNREAGRSHTPYEEEQAILDCVRNGDAVGLEHTWRSLPDIRYGPMTNHTDPLQELFYGSIANTTLVTRAAIEGGMDEESAFSLSDVYIRRMEQAKSLSVLQALNEQMALDFTQRVAAARHRNRRMLPTPVLQCMEAISGGLNHRLTLPSLAQDAGLTPKYLSALFHRATGESLSHYIERMRVEEAKHLLSLSEMSLSDIAQSLAFCSQSHFGAIFRKHAGLTPGQYRDRHAIRHQAESARPVCTASAPSTMRTRKNGESPR